MPLSKRKSKNNEGDPSLDNTTDVAGEQRKETTYTLSDDRDCIIRNYIDSKGKEFPPEPVAYYNEKTGIIEPLPDKDQFRAYAISAIVDLGLNFVSLGKVDEGDVALEPGTPKRPKKKRSAGEKTDALVHWRAKYKPSEFLICYKILRFEQRVGYDTVTKTRINDKNETEEYEEQVPIWAPINKDEYDYDSLVNGEQRAVGKRKTCLTVKESDVSKSDVYEDELFYE